jgi:hypothetical protein
VANVEDLVKIAEHEGRMILHCERESGRDYFVQDQSLTYLYSVRDHPPGRGPAQEAVPVVTSNTATNHADTETTPEDQD